MDQIFEYKLKKGGPMKDKVILFIVLKSKIINYNKKIKKESISKYIETIGNHSEIYVCVDTRITEHVNPKMLWEGSSDIYKHNQILKKHIKGTSILISSKFLKDTVDLILKLYPLETPTKFCKNNVEAMDFLHENMESN